MTDSSLRQDIIDELDFEPSMEAANIGVVVEKSIVTLTGHVPTYSQKMTVEDVVRRVKGVKGIAEEIEVRPVGSNRTADDEIAKRAVMRRGRSGRIANLPILLVDRDRHHAWASNILPSQDKQDH